MSGVARAGVTHYGSPTLAVGFRGISTYIEPYRTDGYPMRAS